MGKDAEELFLKGQQLYKAHQFKKSGKKFHAAGISFIDKGNLEKAKNSFINGAHAFIEIQKYETVLELLRLASETLLLEENYLGANQLYKDSIEYISNLKKADNRDENYILFSVLSYLCLFVKGRQDEGLDYLKRMQKKVDSSHFKENDLIRLVTDLTIALRDKKQDHLEKVKDFESDLKLRKSEISLLKKVILLVQSQILLDGNIILDKQEYTTNEIINLTINFDTTSLSREFKNAFYEFEIKTFEITKIMLDLSDNLSLNKKPNFPIGINVGKINPIELILKPHFQLDKPFIGPAHITCILNNDLIFVYEVEAIEVKLTSPPPSLDISLKNLRPPLIGQSFPLQIQVQNNSEGEALDVKISVEFPELLKVMRGTIEKQIYSLRKNEELNWDLNIKPMEAGEYNIKVKVNFKDPDQNEIEELKEFPFSIKL
ncbi:MAG: hypothetical protein P8Y23_13685 [Candidatus Lokiarchaeota archaeon]